MDRCTARAAGGTKNRLISGRRDSVLTIQERRGHGCPAGFLLYAAPNMPPERVLVTKGGAAMATRTPLMIAGIDMDRCELSRRMRTLPPRRDDFRDKLHQVKRVTYCFKWCPGEDSNLHELLHWYLKPARLPVPPPGHDGSAEREAQECTHCSRACQRKPGCASGGAEKRRRSLAKLLTCPCKCNTPYDTTWTPRGRDPPIRTGPQLRLRIGAAKTRI